MKGREKEAQTKVITEMKKETPLPVKRKLDGP